MASQAIIAATATSSPSRDQTTPQSVPPDSALSMPRMRAHEQPGEPSVAVNILERPEGLAEFWVLLARSIAVPWPLPDAPPVI